MNVYNVIAVPLSFYNTTNTTHHHRRAYKTALFIYRIRRRCPRRRSFSILHSLPFVQFFFSFHILHCNVLLLLSSRINISISRDGRFIRIHC